MPPAGIPDFLQNSPEKKQRRVYVVFLIVNIIEKIAEQTKLSYLQTLCLRPRFLGGAVVLFL